MTQIKMVETSPHIDIGEVSNGFRLSTIAGARTPRAPLTTLPLVSPPPSSRIIGF